MFDPTWKAENDYHCINTTTITIVAGAVSTSGDAYCVALPCLMLHSLDVPSWRKAGLRALFAAGVIVVGIGSVRIWASHCFSVGGDMTW